MEHKPRWDKWLAGPRWPSVFPIRRPQQKPVCYPWTQAETPPLDKDLLKQAMLSKVACRPFSIKTKHEESLCMELMQRALKDQEQTLEARFWPPMEMANPCALSLCKIRKQV